MDRNEVIKICGECGKNFSAYKRKSNQGKRSVGRRPVNSVNCSPKCSRKYSIKARAKLRVKSNGKNNNKRL